MNDRTGMAQRRNEVERMNITPEELARILAAAVGDMLGDSKALDEMGPSSVIFRLCRELERLDREADVLSIWLANDYYIDINLMTKIESGRMNPPLPKDVREAARKAVAGRRRMMSEELMLLPCPACGGRAWAHYDPTTIRIYCPCCDILGPKKDTIEEARAAWNALSRAMTWRTEPRLEAWNWWRDEDSRIPRYVYQDGTITIAMQIDRVPYQDIGGQWCPIPEPREPK